MGLFNFRHKEPVIYKQSHKMEEELTQIETYLETHSNSNLEKKAKLIHYGIEGEKNILFELKNSHLPIYVLHDLYYEYDHLNAQIDYVIITPSKIYFLECKNLVGTIMIDQYGNFSHSYSFHNRTIKEGIYSPITQSNRHLDLYQRMRGHDKGKVMKAMFDMQFKKNYQTLVVLANPQSILKHRYAPKNIKNKVIKADQLIQYIKNHEESPIRNEKQMKETADIFMSYHIEKEQVFQVPPEPTINREMLIGALKSYRLAKAKENQLPAYYIFNDVTLNKLVEQLPQTLEELKLVYGFGPKKSAAYGLDIIQIIKENHG